MYKVTKDQWFKKSAKQDTKNTMAISEFEIKRTESELEKYLAKNRPPAHLRHQVDIGYRISGQSVELFEIRPHWKAVDSKIETPVAKATFVKTKGYWKVFWMQQDLKWHRYDSNPEVSRIEDFLQIVSEDEHSCFFG
ncbi:MAG: DUF3024 domain-containing protein [Gammaproteobacteria bacterium]|nr:DUF3024 domain-containing protein [Gammaproteobacteria bacterium]MBU1468666.1 DUF3024 domain-containing protein [Gammaproteobacteria bacterium]MBU2022021.1 DUF3024 domain-containing protein [Gammaproteobacteria bacterium]MBU2239271.1 DUF3024 domain-containing protein [Gammaproteobacteria bacterium]MBU2318261.1 DUF3024 domain-containing protein [Gammaproteobacteria bacterium]